MARNGSDTFVKRNNKLEAFLKRNLDEDTFERIRAHEACVVCSKKEDKAFKFVVLSDEWLYLTENPPKKVTEEVHLGNIVSIKLVNDFPDFLSGEERENTQHILIKYMAREPQKLKGKAKKQVSKEETLNGNLTYRSSLSARSGKSPWLERKTQSLKEMATKHADLPVRRRCSMDADLLRDATDNERSNKKTNTKKKSKKSKDSENSSEEDSLSKSSQGRQLPRLLPSPSEQLDKNRFEKPLHHTHSGELRLALEKLDEQEDGENGDGDQTVRTSRLTNNNNNDLSKSTTRFSFFKKPKELEQEVEENEDDTWHSEELHLYILNFASAILMLTRAAWNNYLIRETLEQDPEYVERTIGFMEPKLSASEKFSLLFTQLRTELLQEENSIEELFGLINELKAAAERQFALKKLFWRTPEMFLFFIRQLKLYLPNSPAKMFAESEDDKSQRADEIEFAILLLETLSLMFRETEILPSRLSCLRSGQGRAAHELVEILIAQPHLLDIDPPKRGSLSLTLGLGRTTSPLPDWGTEADLELLTLAGELNEAATVVLSELILIAQQTNWGNGEGSFLNLCWLVKIVDEQDSKESFLQQVVMRALRLISPTNQEELLPAEAVTLFYEFSVLQTMLEYSPSSTTFIRDNFFEEFKYFLQGPVILSKLPQHFPVSETTIKLIEKVMSVVLEKAVSLALNNALK